MVKSATESRQELYNHAEDMRFAMLTTIQGDGTLYSCPMTFQERDEQGNMWFFLEKDSETASNLQSNVNLSLAFSCPEKNTFVAITGVGQLIEDPVMVAKLWKEELKAWFPQGKNDPKLALLRVDPQKGQYWDSPSSTLETVVGYVKNIFGSEERGTHLGENRKVSM